jgi:hypothetical protein
MQCHDPGRAQPPLGFLLANASEREREARLRELRALDDLLRSEGRW